LLVQDAFPRSSALAAAPQCISSTSKVRLSALTFYNTSHCADDAEATFPSYDQPTDILIFVAAQIVVYATGESHAPDSPLKGTCDSAELRDISLGSVLI
jgi:hypothetical protein